MPVLSPAEDLVAGQWTAAEEQLVRVLPIHTGHVQVLVWTTAENRVRVQLYDVCTHTHTHTQRYVLVSVVEHRGEPWSGHFVTFRKTCGWNQWISTSDTQVLECSRHAVQNTTAYMLFYQRTASRPQLNVVS